ncbi:MAG: hypothetical protein FHK82_08440 [Sedimenticola thiotaurini]|uniref:VTT domain-containing protein n=1 Tax=Sedimenticola thiotaurini TaxID=1543721 RepID=A0A558D2W3_9GAMM|nr:MAG: hypothetical protein FHK82_08440 [Sedimenticola thiotaurini]
MTTRLNIWSKYSLNSPHSIFPGQEILKTCKKLLGKISAYFCFKIVLVLGVVAFLNSAGIWLAHNINTQFLSNNRTMFFLSLLCLFFVYIVLLALPFIPGIEIGLALMFLMGAKGALLVYISTIVALSISYFIGGAIPSGLICKGLEWLHMNKACAMIRQHETLNANALLQVLNNKAPTRFIPFLLRHRYIAIATALNLPGNSLMGGGGGIAMMVGISRLISYPKFLLLQVVAIAPVPLWFIVF